MSDFDDIVSQLRHPSTTYVPDGSGFWSNGMPCVTCGSIAVVLDDVPACVVCTARTERMHVNAELLLRAVDELLADARLLPEQERRTLAVSALLANVQLQKILRALA